MPRTGPFSDWKAPSDQNTGPVTRTPAPRGTERLPSTPKLRSECLPAPSPPPTSAHAGPFPSLPTQPPAPHADLASPRPGEHPSPPPAQPLLLSPLPVTAEQGGGWVHSGGGASPPGGPVSPAESTGSVCGGFALGTYLLSHWLGSCRTRSRPLFSRTPIPAQRPQGRRHALLLQGPGSEK